MVLRQLSLSGKSVGVVERRIFTKIYDEFTISVRSELGVGSFFAFNDGCMHVSEI